MKATKENKVVLYQDENGITNVSVLFSDEDLWLTQNQIAEIVVISGKIFCNFFEKCLTITLQIAYNNNERRVKRWQHLIRNYDPRGVSLAKANAFILSMDAFFFGRKA